MDGTPLGRRFRTSMALMRGRGKDGGSRLAGEGEMRGADVAGMSERGDLELVGWDIDSKLKS